MSAIETANHHVIPMRDIQESSTVASGASPSQASRSNRARWAGRVLSAIGVLFLTFDATIKVLQLPAAVEATAQLGYPSITFGLGMLEVILLVAYLIPRTSVLGAILWTGYLGGAIATHLRVGNPLFSHVLFPIYVAALLWGGLWLRDEQLASMIPIRTKN